MAKKDAEKKLSFKDYLNVDYKDGEDELFKTNSKKRKVDESYNAIHNSKKSSMKHDHYDVVRHGKPVGSVHHDLKSGEVSMDAHGKKSKFRVSVDRDHRRDMDTLVKTHLWGRDRKAARNESVSESSGDGWTTRGHARIDTGKDHPKGRYIHLHVAEKPYGKRRLPHVTVSRHHKDGSGGHVLDHQKATPGTNWTTTMRKVKGVTSSKQLADTLNGLKHGHSGKWEHVKESVQEAKANPSGAKVGDKFIYNDSTHVVTKVTPDSVHGKSKIGGARSFHHKHYQGFSKVTKEDVDVLENFIATEAKSVEELDHTKYSDKDKYYDGNGKLQVKQGAVPKANKAVKRDSNNAYTMRKPKTKFSIAQRGSIHRGGHPANYREEVEVLESFVTESIDEALSFATRRKKARDLRKNKAKIKMGRRKAARRMADLPRLKKRSQKQARNKMFKKLSKGISRSDMSPARRAQIEKRLDKMGGRIERIAKKTLPLVRKQEIARKRGNKKSVNTQGK